MLHPVFKRPFQYSLQGEYLGLLSDGDYATIPSEQGCLICVFTKGDVSVRYSLVSHLENLLVSICPVYK